MVTGYKKRRTIKKKNTHRTIKTTKSGSTKKINKTGKKRKCTYKKSFGHNHRKRLIGGNNDNDLVNCCICKKTKHLNNVDEKLFMPLNCLRKHGYRSHRICQDCWWSKFAIEGENHTCPGCQNNMPLSDVKKRTPSSSNVIVLE